MLPKVAAAVRPDLLIVSAGFDYAAGDPVGDLGVGREAAGALATAIASVAHRFSAGGVAYVLEGGYDLDVLTESIAADRRGPRSRPRRAERRRSGRSSARGGLWAGPNLDALISAFFQGGEAGTAN